MCSTLQRLLYYFISLHLFALAIVMETCVHVSEQAVLWLVQRLWWHFNPVF